jgi:thioredoxin 1
MKRTILILVSFIVLAFLAAGCESGKSAPAAPLSTPELQKTIGAGGKSTIVFFLNPQGGPCQMQNGVLEKLYKDRGGNFNVAYVSSLKPENEKAFYDYGVRNLPSMVLVNKDGKIDRVFPPGIQSYETIAAALESAK